MLLYLLVLTFLIPYKHRLFGAQSVAAAIPPKPKKPLTPYFRFLGQVREDVKKENPNLKPTGNYKL